MYHVNDRKLVINHTDFKNNIAEADNAVQISRDPFVDKGTQLKLWCQKLPFYSTCRIDFMADSFVLKVLGFFNIAPSSVHKCQEPIFIETFIT